MSDRCAGVWVKITTKTQRHGGEEGKGSGGAGVQGSEKRRKVEMREGRTV
jgi:hypothetical protein